PARPLPTEPVASGALDVELLVDRRKVLARERQVGLGAIQNAVQEHARPYHPDQVILPRKRDQDVLDLVADLQLVPNALLRAHDLSVASGGQIEDEPGATCHPQSQAGLVIYKRNSDTAVDAQGVLQ